MSSTGKIPDPAIFFRRLREVRERCGISKAETARRLGISAQRYQRYEENRIPAALTLNAIAQLFDVTTDWLLGGPSENTLGTLPVVLDSPGSYPPASSTLRASASLRENAPTCRIPEGCDIVERLDRLETEIHTLTRLLGASLALAPQKDAEKKKVG